MSTSPDLGLPLVATAQASPEVTHNEAVTLLAALFNGVIGFGGNTPAVAPVAGDAYIVGAAPTGAWNGRANCIALYTSGGWRFLPGDDSNGSAIPMGVRQTGLHVVVRSGTGSPSELTWAVWNGSTWKQALLPLF